MADLATSGVVVDKVSSITLSNGIVLWRKECTVTLASMGSTTNRILATAFGLSAISSTSNWISNDATPRVVPAVFNYDRSLILLANLAEAVDANRTNGTDLSGTFRCMIEGY